MLTKLMTDGIYINNALCTFIWRIAFCEEAEYRPVFDCKIGRQQLDLRVILHNRNCYDKDILTLNFFSVLIYKYFRSGKVNMILAVLLETK